MIIIMLSFTFTLNKKIEFIVNQSKFALRAKKETGISPIMKQIPPHAATQAPDGLI